MFIDAVLTDAQIGAATRLLQLGKIEVSEPVFQQISSARVQTEINFSRPSVAADQAFNRIKNIRGLNLTLGKWLFEADSSWSQVNIGYWLMCVFLRGLDLSETVLMTSFLSGTIRESTQKKTRRSVRRYPTGGISEKQALLLPALLRHVCEKYEWSSSFLVARRLAHTGGTYDKLSVLPGLKFASSDDLHSWDGIQPPIRYFSAGADFCPRDELLYRFRGETGTVADIGLMASSIMSKQVAMPADVIVLDILFGATAFLPSEQDADQFLAWCETVANEFDICFVPYVRRCDDPLGRCIGNAVEVWEAVKVLEDASRQEPQFDGELHLALSFMRLFAKHLGIAEEDVTRCCTEGLQSGHVLQALFQLWKEHGVESSFVESVRVNSHIALLGDLTQTKVVAPFSGILFDVDSLAVADVVNNRFNSYIKGPSGEIVGVTRGGIELLVKKGSVVSKGDLLAVLYSELPLPPQTAEMVLGLFQLRRAL